jgi:hypothetical protein
MSKLFRFSNFKVNENVDGLYQTIKDIIEHYQQKIGAKDWFDFAGKGKWYHHFKNDLWLNFIENKDEAAKNIIDTARRAGIDIDSRAENHERGEDLVIHQIKVLLYKNRQKDIDTTVQEIVKLLNNDIKVQWRSSAFNTYRNQEMGEDRDINLEDAY